jgi:thiamine-phosphate pyrophosphorylase
MTFPSTRPILCAVTDRRRFQAADARAACDALVAYAEDLADAGIDLLQVREPDLDDATLLQLVERTCAATRGSRTRVLVNERVDIALAAGAAGVHLRAASYSAVRARALLGDAAIIGRSVHGADETSAAVAAGGLDYVVFGTVFATRSKPEGHPVAGLDGLRETVRACGRLPVLAIGGVTGARAGEIAATGAAGIAAIGLFLEAGSSVGAGPESGPGQGPDPGPDPGKGRRGALRALAERLRVTYNPR